MKVTVLSGGAELRKSRTAAEPSSRMIVSLNTLFMTCKGRLSKLGKLSAGSSLEPLGETRTT